MEYLFKKDALQKLINDATDSNVVAISVNFKCDEGNSVYNAEITAKAAIRNVTTGAQVYSQLSDPVDGCPNPPGCTSIMNNNIMKAMNII